MYLGVRSEQTPRVRVYLVMPLLSLICGIILMVIGLVGEYIGRIYISINNNPQYVIRETINIEKNGRKTK